MQPIKHKGSGAKVIKGSIVTFCDRYDPNNPTACVRHIPKGAIAVAADGRIEWVGEASKLPADYGTNSVDDYGDKLVLAGFIDTHIHFPQYRMLAAASNGLLDWLERYTFPEELKYRSKEYAAAAAERFLKELYKNGTTSALAFSTVHTESAEALFEAALKNNMALFTGKTMMDRSAPDGLTDRAEANFDECQNLINKWHRKERLGYAITPRFAITSSEAQLECAGDLLKANPSCLMQTHLSESLGEIETVKGLFPDAVDYTDVYDRFNLVTDRSVFAHGVHLSEREILRLSEAGSAVIHCPTSNTFLGSGLFEIARMKDATTPTLWGLATDIGAGTSYSMLATMAEAFKVAMLNGYRLTALEAFYTASLGNAHILKLESEIGSIEAGKWADLIILDPNATDTLRNRMQLSETLEDTLFALMMLGDDRTIQATYVAGNIVHQS